jgi:hypothetical protein
VPSTHAPEAQSPSLVQDSPLAQSEEQPEVADDGVEEVHSPVARSQVSPEEQSKSDEQDVGTGVAPGVPDELGFQTHLPELNIPMKMPLSQV